MARIGERLGPYDLIAHVRSGRYSSVFRGVRRDGRRAPREVALQVVEAGPDAPIADRMTALRRQYETLRALDDPRIPAPLALYTGHNAIALPWVEGTSLRDVLRLVDAGRLDLDAGTSIDILVELSHALRHVHAVPIQGTRTAHGALAPEVVVLGPDGGVTLLGLADPDPAHAWAPAPEQMNGVSDHRTDQWLLGSLGLQLLRHAPEMRPATRGAKVEVVFATLQALWPAAARVIARLLAEDPTHRFENDDRVIRDLLALARALGGSSRRSEVGAKAAQLLERGQTEPLAEPGADEPPARPAPARVLVGAAGRPRGGREPREGIAALLDGAPASADEAHADGARTKAARDGERREDIADVANAGVASAGAPARGPEAPAGTGTAPTRGPRTPSAGPPPRPPGVATGPVSPTDAATRSDAATPPGATTGAGAAMPTGPGSAAPSPRPVVVVSRARPETVGSTIGTARAGAPKAAATGAATTKPTTATAAAATASGSKAPAAGPASGARPPTRAAPGATPTTTDALASGAGTAARGDPTASGAGTAAHGDPAASGADAIAHPAGVAARGDPTASGACTAAHGDPTASGAGGTERSESTGTGTAVETVAAPPAKALPAMPARGMAGVAPRPPRPVDEAEAWARPGLEGVDPFAPPSPAGEAGGEAPTEGVPEPGEGGADAGASDAATPNGNAGDPPIEESESTVLDLNVHELIETEPADETDEEGLEPLELDPPEPLEGLPAPRIRVGPRAGAVRFTVTALPAPTPVTAIVDAIDDAEVEAWIADATRDPASSPLGAIGAAARDRSTVSDPVPDAWVVGAIVVFGVVAVSAALWAVGG